MGMFLEKTIPSGLSVEQTISRIRAQGGLVCIPHPFDVFRRSALRSNIIEEIAEQIDIIEIFNSRTLLPQDSAKTLALASKYGKAKSAGSDAHTLYEIGNAYVEMPEFNGKDDFLQALEKGNIHGHRTSPLVHFVSNWTKIKKRWRG
jgi:hypothetical protein